MTLSQQKSIVSALGLANSSLYDSLIIDIVTDFLRFAKSKGLTPGQTHSIYHILQELLYGLQNDKEWDAKQSAEGFAEGISNRVRAANNNENADGSNDKIGAALCEDILSFFEERLLSQFPLYRTALFSRNPSNAKYADFQKRFKVGDIVRFH